MTSLSLSIVEIIVLMLGAITLGITIHYLISSKKSLSEFPLEKEKMNKTLEEWKLRYFNDTELRDKELAMLQKQVAEIEENNEINTIEAEEVRKMNKKLKAEMELLKKNPVATVSDREKPDYIQQLKNAQSSLMEHNDKINQLLGQIDLVKENEEKQQEIIDINEKLTSQVNELKRMLSQKEKEINNSKENQKITNEMTSMIDSAYNEFNVLQDKIQKLEGQVNSSKTISLEHEDLKENHVRISRDFDDLKKKYNASSTENKQLIDDLSETEDKLKEANFQRQQLQKRVAYLEELNNDMQVVAEANKKLESQLKRVAELESMLNVISGERDNLASKHAD